MSTETVNKKSHKRLKRDSLTTMRAYALSTGQSPVTLCSRIKKYAVSEELNPAVTVQLSTGKRHFYRRADLEAFNHSVDERIWGRKYERLARRALYWYFQHRISGNSARYTLAGRMRNEAIVRHGSARQACDALNVAYKAFDTQPVPYKRPTGVVPIYHAYTPPRRKRSGFVCQEDRFEQTTNKS